MEEIRNFFESDNEENMNIENDENNEVQNRNGKCK